jgi:predicted TIM-barrel enzyme
MTHVVAIGTLDTKGAEYGSVELVQEIRDAAVEVNPDVIVLCHGGPIAEPEDATYVLERTRGVAGFFGASSMERLPTEVAMTQTVRRFKELHPSPAGST